MTYASVKSCPSCCTFYGFLHVSDSPVAVSNRQAAVAEAQPISIAKIAPDTASTETTGT